mgnify:CR=1 FL=1
MAGAPQTAADGHFSFDGEGISARVRLWDAPGGRVRVRLDLTEGHAGVDRLFWAGRAPSEAQGPDRWDWDGIATLSARGQDGRALVLRAGASVEFMLDGPRRAGEVRYLGLAGHGASTPGGRLRLLAARAAGDAHQAAARDDAPRRDAGIAAADARFRAAFGAILGQPAGAAQQTLAG